LLPDRVTLIDETNRGDHRYLDATDKCYFFGEYFASKGYQGGGTNQLIFNYKCKPTIAVSNPARRGHKDRAIQTIAAGLRNVIAKDSAERITRVPIPPSKAESDPDYDDRLSTVFGVLRIGRIALIRPSAGVRTIRLLPAGEHATTPEVAARRQPSELP
jgi:hypothetical protein